MPSRTFDPLIDVTPADGADSYTVDTGFLDRVFDAEQVLAMLRGRPLLGPDRVVAPARIRFVAGVLQELPDDLASTDLLALAGDFALEAGHGEAVDRYLRGADCARRRADFVRERAMHLRACRAVARFRGPAAATGFFEELGAVEDEPCPIDWLLTLAEMQPEHALTHLTEALDLLDAPHQAHFRLTALEDLAERLVAGSESELALRHLGTALELAQQWDDPGRVGQVHAQMAGIHLVGGRPDLAMAPLQAALDGALSDGDDLLVVAHGTLLCAMSLDRKKWKAAETCARQVLAAAERRGNWLGVADAALAWSSAHVGRQNLGPAVAILARTLLTLRAHGAHAGGALLHARLGELRADHGAEIFDPMLDRVVTALRAP